MLKLLSDVRVAAIADQTPPHRDRVIDAVRTFALLTVVIGHWLMATVVFSDGSIAVTNTMAVIPSLQFATWFLQVMPLFFVAGGFANRTVWLRGKAQGIGFPEFVRVRLFRLIIPTLVFVLFWIIALAQAVAQKLSWDEIDFAGRSLGQPLWFLAVYLLVTVAAPAMSAAHDRAPKLTIAILLVGAIVIDALRFGFGNEAIAYINIAFVWLLAQQIGFWYQDGKLFAIGRTVWWATLGGAVIALVAATGLGPYPFSMVGMPGEISNMAPPSLCMVILAVGQTAALMLGRGWLGRRLERPRPWARIVVVGSMTMTLYLWHISLLVVLYVAMRVASIDIPETGTVMWWLTRPLWLGMLAIALLAIAGPLSRLEAGVGKRKNGTALMPGNSFWRNTLAVVATVVGSIGIFGVVLGGVNPSPWEFNKILTDDPIQNVVYMLIALGLAKIAAGDVKSRKRADPPEGESARVEEVPRQASVTE